MFLKQYDTEFLHEKFMPHNQWQPFPQADNRTAWNKLLSEQLNQERKKCVVEEANAILGTPWPQLPASLYMEFKRTGNRRRYEAPYFERRNRLSTLVLAECMSHEGKFLDEIVNGLWTILEELTWCIPAHAFRYDNDPLPAHDQEHVDLFACETAMILAETLYLLNDKFENFSHSLCERVRQAVLNRVIIPVETRDDFWWFEGTNNWTPWCASNVLGSAMYILKDTNRLSALSVKLMNVVDRFIANYSNDGGCDEGPRYWNVGAGAMLLFLELLYSRSNGAVDIYNEPLIKKMGSFIVRARLAGHWFINFADSSAKIDIRRAVVYQYGKRIGNEKMKNLALLSARNWQKDNSVSSFLNRNFSGGDLIHTLREMFWIPADAKPTETQLDMTTWLPNIQTLIIRECAADSKGLVLAAKGGHNAENHNHNDVGQFIIFLNGQPGIIDIGVETYSKKTFSDSRYDIWCIRSAGHNVPKVNGYEQCADRECCATDVEFTESENELEASLSMGIANAYPKAAGIINLRRQFIFKRENPASITVRDSFEMDSGVPRVTVPLFCREKVELVEQGKLLINTKPLLLVLGYPAKILQPKVTTVPIEDEKLREVWGPSLQKIEFEYLGNKDADSYELVFRSQRR